MTRALLAAVAALILAAPGTAVAALPTQEHLERQKLEQEIRKLKNENDRAERKLEDFLRLVPVLTAVGAFFAIGVPVWKEIRERREQRAKELTQRADELEQRKLEAQRRLEDQFAKAIGDLASDKEADRILAAVTLENIVRAEYVNVPGQVYPLIVAGLTIDQGPLGNKFLVRAFGLATRAHIAAAAARDEAPVLEFVRCVANRVDLSKLDLHGADFAFGQFRNANLTDCDLTRALGYEANFEKARFSRSKLTEVRFHSARCKEAQFHGTVMTSAELRGADLSNAQLQQAKLQGAHLDDADLTGARFDQANVSDTYFTGATVEDRVLRSILNAVDGTWRKAHFDPAVEARLEELSARRREN